MGQNWQFLSKNFQITLQNKYLPQNFLFSFHPKKVEVQKSRFTPALAYQDGSKKDRAKLTSLFSFLEPPW